MIVLARDSRGWLQKELAKKIGVSQAKISKYENGLLLVSDEDLNAIAAETGYTREFFFCTDPIYGLGSSLLFNRKKKTAPIGKQREVQAKVNIARMQVERFLRSAEIESLNQFEAIDSQDFDGDASEVARRVRAGWRMPMGPIQSVTTAIESAGGVVLLCDFNTTDIDAAHLWVPGGPPLFCMNKHRSGDRHRFNLAHELGHAVMHQFPAGDIEQEANTFAAEFLMPAREISEELHDLTLEKLAGLKQRWRVSMAALVYRAKELGCISNSKYTSLFATLGRLGYRLAEPIEIAIEQPSLIYQLIDIHRRGLGYTDGDLLELLMTDEPDFIDACAKIKRPLRINDAPIPFETHLKRRQA